MQAGEAVMEEQQQSNAVLANEIKHLTKSVDKLTEYLKERDGELNERHSDHEARITKLESVPSAASAAPRSMKDRLADNPGFWLFAASVVYVGGKDMIAPILKAFGVAL